MSKIQTIKYLWKNNKREILVALFNHIVKTGIFNSLSDEKYVSLMYYVHIGSKLDLKNPKGFNEKLQWLKIYDHNPKYVSMVDKYAVKEYVAEKIGKQYIIPTLGVWKKYDDINFEALPDKFVLKCTHDSGSVCVCSDRKQFNYEKAKKKLDRALSRNLYYWGREWPYKMVEPQIIAEQYLDDGNNGLVDYKFMCFNGQVKCVFTVTNRFSQNDMHVTFYDMEWNIMPFTRHYNADSIPIKKPQSYDKMLKIAEVLAADLIFARIDFYEINGKPYFGEITLCPGNGVEEFKPKEWDNILGSWMDISKLQGEKKK